jgi:hypothetical protein
MKNAKKLTRKMKEFLEDKGFDPKYYLIVKNTSDYYIFLNTETGVTFELERW